MNVNLVFTVVFSLFYLNGVNSFQCMDHNNNTVDWYVLYKLPHIKKDKENKLIKGGVAYTFMTSNSANTWKLSPLPITEVDTILGLTLAPLYTNNVNESTMYILYNDQPPNKKSNLKKGHTKGVLVSNSTSGFWMVHSVPDFPPATYKGFSYPQTGTVYGQSFLCISLDLENINEIGVQLQYNAPQIYAQNMPSALSILLPHINDVMNRVPILNPPWYNTLNFTSKGGYNFVSYAKNKNFGKDLYEDWLAPSLGSSLLVETWLNGAGHLPSNCTKPFSVKNIASITMGVANVTFNSALDHSKWAISTNNTYWTCIGDINRAEHQKHRGGGTVCMNNKLITTSFQQSVNSTEAC